VRCLAFSPDGRFLLSAALDNTVRIWNMRGGSVKVFTNPESRREFKTATFSPDGKYVAAGNGDGIVRIWDVRTGQLVQRLKGHTGIVYGVAFMPHGKGLVSGSKDSTLKYWNIASLEHIWSLHTKEPQTKEPKPIREFSGHIVHFSLYPFFCFLTLLSSIRVLSTPLLSRMTAGGLSLVQGMRVSVSGMLIIWYRNL